MGARIAALCLLWLAGLGLGAPARADALRARLQYWESQAFLCTLGAVRFPSSTHAEPDQSQPCNDGDMTLFNGLLCAAGDARGCRAVADAQDELSGEWHRSPRLRQLGRNDRGDASFSPDMALGVQLYLVSTGDSVRAAKWLAYLDRLVACSIELFGTCLVRAPLPRFCTHPHCDLRPGDSATLAQTVDYLQRHAALAPLPHGRLRGNLGTFAPWSGAVLELDSMFNKPGYSQHLVGVTVLLLRRVGRSDARLDQAAARLAEKNPNNAFFLYLNEGPTARTRQTTLDRCPSPQQPSLAPHDEWQWERGEDAAAWKHSNHWDCIFMARLLGQ